MRTPTPDQLLSVWERAFERRPAERALALLQLAMPELDEEAAARCSIGQRDACLLALHERLFGTELASVAQCPACKTMVESTWSTQDLRAGIGPGHVPLDASGAACQASVLELRTAAHCISYRLPTTADMLAVGDAGDPAAAARLLLERCVIAASCDGAPVALACLPPSALEALEDGMAAADPMADIECALACPACGHAWRIDFDIGRYLWSEIHSWAQRLLVDVHKLARAYGWREADIVAMSPGRRALYVEMSAS